MLKSNLILKLGLILKSNLILKLGFIFKSNLILKLGFILKSNLILKLAFILKKRLILKLSVILKFVYIQNFEFILNILEHPKPIISNLKQPGRQAACYLEITPLHCTSMHCPGNQIWFWGLPGASNKRTQATNPPLKLIGRVI